MTWRATNYVVDRDVHGVDGGQGFECMELSRFERCARGQGAVGELLCNDLELAVENRDEEVAISAGRLQEGCRGVDRPHVGRQQVEHHLDRGIRREDLAKIADSIIGLHEPLTSAVNYKGHVFL